MITSKKFENEKKLNNFVDENKIKVISVETLQVLIIMITSKKFENEKKLNNFVDENKIKVISVETLQEDYDTGLPLASGFHGKNGTFVTKHDIFKLWYDDRKS